MGRTRWTSSSAWIGQKWEDVFHTNSFWIFYRLVAIRLFNLLTLDLKFPSSYFLFQGATFGTLLVFDRDLTTTYPEEDSHNKYVGTLLNSDSWVRGTFDVKGIFTEKKAALGGVRESVNSYRKLPWLR